MKYCRLLLRKIHLNDASAAPKDIARAESLWVIEAQLMLSRSKNFGQWEKKFDLFQDDDKIWRCGGRIQNASIPYCTMHPVLLTKDHFLAELLVRRAHERVMHSGVKSTLTELRSQYWIVRGRSFVKQIIGGCVLCKRLEGSHIVLLLRLPCPLPSRRSTAIHAHWNRLCRSTLR